MIFISYGKDAPRGKAKSRGQKIQVFTSAAELADAIIGNPVETIQKEFDKTSTGKFLLGKKAGVDKKINKLVAKDVAKNAAKINKLSFKRAAVDLAYWQYFGPYAFTRGISAGQLKYLNKMIHKTEQMYVRVEQAQPKKKPLVKRVLSKLNPKSLGKKSKRRRGR